MLEFQTKIKRQIEIVGLSIDSEPPLKPVDLAALFNCEELTIKRDLQELRSYGINIHSVTRKGICLESPLDARQLRELVIQYIGITGGENTFDKATVLMVRQQKQKALGNIVRLQRSIERSTVAIVDYVKEGEAPERGREIGPLQLFQSDGYWRVLALHNGLIKQYHLNKILNVQSTDRGFKRVPQEQIDEMFRHSFRSWVGPEKHRVRVSLSRVWADRVRPKQMMETQELVEYGDGSVVFSLTVNSLEEFASWVVSRGEGVTVLEPPRLRAMVMSIAQGVLKNYTESGYSM